VRRIASALFVVALLGAPSSAAAANSCPTSGRTVAENRLARVWSQPATRDLSPTVRVYGCIKAEKRRVLLAELAKDGAVTTETLEDVTLDRRRIEWTRLTITHGWKDELDTYSWTRQVVSVRSGYVLQSREVRRLGRATAEPVWRNPRGGLRVSR
jgi:hypothetical protein